MGKQQNIKIIRNRILLSGPACEVVIPVLTIRKKSEQTENQHLTHQNIEVMGQTSTPQTGETNR